MKSKIDMWARYLNGSYGEVAKKYARFIINSEKLSDKQIIEICKRCDKYLSKLDWYELSPEEINTSIGYFIYNEYLLSSINN